MISEALGCQPRSSLIGRPENIPKQVERATYNVNCLGNGNFLDDTKSLKVGIEKQSVYSIPSCFIMEFEKAFVIKLRLSFNDLPENCIPIVVEEYI